MKPEIITTKLDRRTLLKTAAAAGALQIASPFVITARAADNVKIGLDNPLTGTFAAVGKNELDRRPARGRADKRQGRHSRPQGRSTGRGFDRPAKPPSPCKRRNKLIERDKVDFLLGNINSALAQAMANVSFEKKVFHIVPGGHTNSVTGTQCHWNVFRVCNTTRMETNSVSKLLLKNYGKKWYFITTDYAFGRSSAGRLRGEPEGG